jgi:hypothetical protein
MREVTELTELEAELIRRPLLVYPGALGYSPARDPRELAAELVNEGRLERVEVVDAVDPNTGLFAEWMIAYRLSDQHAEEIRRSAAAKAEVELMSEDKQQRKEQMVEDCLDAYAKLVGAFASHLRAGHTSRRARAIRGPRDSDHAASPYASGGRA